MTHNPLRLVVDRGDDTAPSAIELRPTAGAALHIHLHMGPQDSRLPAATVSVPADRETRGHSGRGVIRPLLLGVAGILVAVVAFDVGARSGVGHAEALAAARTSAAGLASLAAVPPEPPTPAAPGGLPASVQQQLAQQPTVIPAPGTAATGGSNPFGLQH